VRVFVNAVMIVAAGSMLAGCERTVRSDLPTGTQAYEAIAIPAEVANPTAYLLRAGDRINMSVLQEEDFSADKILIDNTGNVTLPIIGTIHAAGLTPDGLAAQIRERLAQTYLRDPVVSVLLETPAVTTISVEGEVEYPGVFEIAPGHTLLTALALARSPTDKAKLDQVMIFRTVDGERYGGRFDVAAIRAGRVPDPLVIPGDVVVVGYSQARGVFQDFLKAAPLLNVFTRY